jgi:hypothetical protein
MVKLAGTSKNSYGFEVAYRTLVDGRTARGLGASRK